jgi:hypothetical protein
MSKLRDVTMPQVYTPCAGPGMEPLTAQQTASHKRYACDIEFQPVVTATPPAMPHGIINQLDCAQLPSAHFCVSCILVRGLMLGTAASVTLTDTPCAACGSTRMRGLQPRSRRQPSTATGAAPISGCVGRLSMSARWCHLWHRLHAASCVSTPSVSLQHAERDQHVVWHPDVSDCQGTESLYCHAAAAQLRDDTGAGGDAD